MTGSKINIILGHSFGGIMSVYDVIIKNLNKEKEFNVNIITFNFKGDENDFFPENEKVNIGINPPISNFKTIIFLIKFYKIINAKSGNKFIVNNPSLAILIFLLSYFKRIKFLIHIHEPISSILNQKSTFSKYIYMILLRSSLKKSTNVIYISRSVKNDYNTILKTKKGIVINNPISIKDIVVKSSKPAQLHSGYINFVTVGRLTKAKGYHELIYAIKLLNEWGYSNFKLRIIGDGELKNDLNALIIKLNLVNEINLVGYISNPYNYISQSDCYISSSKWEGFGLTILYAMVLQKPIISSATDGAKELLKSSKHFYELNNVTSLAVKLREFLDNTTFLNDTLDDNYSRARQYDEEDIVKKFKVEFEILCS